MASLHVLLTEAICILKQWFSLRSSSVVLLSSLLAASSETRFTAKKVSIAKTIRIRHKCEGGI